MREEAVRERGRYSWTGIVTPRSMVWRGRKSMERWIEGGGSPGYDSSMATIHVSEDEAGRDLSGLLARVRAGDEVVIDDGLFPSVVIHTSVSPRRSIDECIALAREHEKESGEAPVLDADFASDVEEIIRNRSSSEPPSWD